MSAESIKRIIARIDFLTLVIFVGHVMRIPVPGIIFPVCYRNGNYEIMYGTFYPECYVI